jgi:sugar lactone lactonase YvrE
MAILRGAKQTVEWQALDDGLEVLAGVCCELGEGIFFGENGYAAYWFDIDKNRYFMLEDHSLITWQLPITATAGYQRDANSFVLATEDGLQKVEISGEAFTHSLLLDIPLTGGCRTNDGRSDPWGGFWFSSMSRELGGPSGSIFRYHNNELRTVASGLKIPNSICVHPSRTFALFSDTAAQQIFSVTVDDEGWPIGNAETVTDFSGSNYFPDGAIFDPSGNLYVAMWGLGRISIFDSDFQEIGSLRLPTPYVTCPALDPHDQGVLWVTSAAPTDSPACDHAGRLFRIVTEQ